jgi:D-glycero-alpha-D-manno-heptose 1-phosphate guanylyltransferase
MNLGGEQGDAADKVVGIILAGGLGTRIRHLYPDLPKALLRVAGRPWLDWVILWLSRQGVQRFVLSLGYRGEMVEAYYRRAPLPGLEVRACIEREPMGTAGGMALASQLAPWAEVFVVANGDSIVSADIRSPLREFAASGAAIGLIALPMNDCGRYGQVEVDPSGRLKGFREKTPGPGMINTGVYFMRRTIINAMPRIRPLSLEIDIFPELVARGTEIRVYPCQAAFLDIGTPSSLEEAHGFIQEHLLRAIA